MVKNYTSMIINLHNMNHMSTLLAY